MRRGVLVWMVTLSFSGVLTVALASPAGSAKTHNTALAGKTHKPEHEKAKGKTSIAAHGANGSLTFSGSLNGTTGVVAKDLNCSFPPTDISISVPVNGKYYALYINYSVAKPGTTTNLQTGGETTEGDAVLVTSPEGATEWASVNPPTSGSVTVNTSKSGSINATLAASSGGQAEHISGSWKCPS